MTDPYETLGVAVHSDETAIRHRYLELVREFPPERDPQRFAAIRAAYDELRDPAVRLRSLLFRVGTEDSIAAMSAEVRKRLRTTRIPTKTLLSLAKP